VRRVAERLRHQIATNEPLAIPFAARGIRGFTDMLKHHAERAPLRRNVELREVGDAAVFLASRMASGITGEVLYVDCGYSIMAV